MAKTKTKTKPKTKPLPKPVVRRAHKGLPIAKRMREATHARPHPQQQKARPTMTATEETKTTQPREQRGAGTGENAVAYRNRKDAGKENDIGETFKKAQAEAVANNQKTVDKTKGYGEEDAPEELETTEYPEPDPAKGRIDPENYERPIAMRDRRAYLLDQGQKNQDANDTLNAMQVEQNKRIQYFDAYMNDPDYMREVSMQTSITALEMHDPEKVKERQQKMKERRDKLQAEQHEKAKQETDKLEANKRPGA